MEEEGVSGLRPWFRKNVRMAILGGTAIVTMFAVVAGFSNYSGTTLATSVDIAELRTEIDSNTQLIMGDRWLRLTEEIKVLKVRLKEEPRNMDVIKEQTTKEFQLRAVEKSMDKK